MWSVFTRGRTEFTETLSEYTLTPVVTHLSTEEYISQVEL